MGRPDTYNPDDLKKLTEVVERAYYDPTFRGTLIWFPEQVITEYSVGEAAAYVIRTGDLTGVPMDGTLLDKAQWVFDTTDLSSGE